MMIFLFVILTLVTWIVILDVYGDSTESQLAFSVFYPGPTLIGLCPSGPGC